EPPAGTELATCSVKAQKRYARGLPGFTHRGCCPGSSAGSFFWYTNLVEGHCRIRNVDLDAARLRVVPPTDRLGHRAAGINRGKIAPIEPIPIGVRAFRVQVNIGVLDSRIANNCAALIRGDAAEPPFVA